MENSKEVGQFSLLDLNIYVLNEIFKALGNNYDKINLAKAHPQLTEAFRYHGRLQYKEMNLMLFHEDHLSFILQTCGEYIHYMEIFQNVTPNKWQLIKKNCSNLNKVKICTQDYLSMVGNLSTLASLPLRTLQLCSLGGTHIHSLIQLISNCKTLRKLELNEDGFVWIKKFIRTLLDILDKNDVTPEDPLTLVITKRFVHMMGGNDQQNVNSNLLNFEYQEDAYFDAKHEYFSIYHNFVHILWDEA